MLAFDYNTIDKLAKYKSLRGGIKFVDSIPRSQSGKVSRKLLIKSLIAKL